jgi:hypothetical protein
MAIAVTNREPRIKVARSNMPRRGNQPASTSWAGSIARKNASARSKTVYTMNTVTARERRAAPKKAQRIHSSRRRRVRLPARERGAPRAAMAVVVNAVLPIGV